MLRRVEAPLRQNDHCGAIENEENMRIRLVHGLNRFPRGDGGDVPRRLLDPFVGQQHRASSEDDAFCLRLQQTLRVLQRHEDRTEAQAGEKQAQPSRRLAGSVHREDGRGDCEPQHDLGHGGPPRPRRSTRDSLRAAVRGADRGANIINGDGCVDAECHGMAWGVLQG